MLYIYFCSTTDISVLYRRVAITGEMLGTDRAPTPIGTPVLRSVNATLTQFNTMAHILSSELIHFARAHGLPRDVKRAMAEEGKNSPLGGIYNRLTHLQRNLIEDTEDGDSSNFGSVSLLRKRKKEIQHQLSTADSLTDIGALNRELNEVQTQIDTATEEVAAFKTLVVQLMQTVDMLVLVIGDPAYDNPNAFLPYNLSTLFAKIFPFILCLSALGSGGITGLSELMKILPDGATAARVENPVLFTFATGASLLAGSLQAYKMHEGVTVTKRSEKTLASMAGDMSVLLQTLATRKVNAGASALAGGVQTLAGVVSVAITAMGNSGDISEFCSGNKTFDDAGLSPTWVHKLNLSLAITYQVFMNLTLSQSTYSQIMRHKAFVPLESSAYNLDTNAWTAPIENIGLLTALLQEALDVPEDADAFNVEQIASKLCALTNAFKAQGDRNKKAGIWAAGLYGASTLLGTVILGTSAYNMAVDNGREYLKKAACEGVLPDYFPPAVLLYFGIGGAAHVLAGFTGAKPLGYRKEGTPDTWSNRFMALPVISQLSSAMRYLGRTIAHATKLDSVMPASVAQQQRMIIAAFSVMALTKHVLSNTLSPLLEAGQAPHNLSPSRPDVRKIFDVRAEDSIGHEEKKLQFEDDMPLEILSSTIEALLKNDIRHINNYLQLQYCALFPNDDYPDLEEGVQDEAIADMIRMFDNLHSHIERDFENIKHLMENIPKNELQLAYFILKYVKEIAGISTIGELKEQAESGFPALLIGLFK